MKYKIIDGKQVPMLPAKAIEIVKHKKTGKVYASKEEFDKDVADPNTDTKEEHIQRNVKIFAPSLADMIGANED